MIKKFFEIGCICVMLIALSTVVTQNEVYRVPVEETKVEIKVQTPSEKYQEAVAKGKADLVFWYDDASYADYFTNAALAFFEKEDIVVELVYKDAVDYVGEIYQATMKDGAFPDAYLLSGEELEKAHLYGVAGENMSASAYNGQVAKNAMIASACHDKVFGYPLSYNVCLFVYNGQYFETAPASLQAIIDYSDETEPDENVQYLLEWDAYDPFFGFPFVSESVVLNADSVGVLEASYNETVLEESLLFLQESLESFSLPIDKVTEESVIEDVLNGVTLCAIVDSDSMKDLLESDYHVIEFPRLNEKLGAKSAALTDMIVLNDFSEKKEIADLFAKFVTLDNYSNVWNMTGHYPVQLQMQANEREKTAYNAYMKAISAPNSQDAGGFWINIKELITQQF